MTKMSFTHLRPRLLWVLPSDDEARGVLVREYIPSLEDLAPLHTARDGRGGLVERVLENSRADNWLQRCHDACLVVGLPKGTNSGPRDSGRGSGGGGGVVLSVPFRRCVDRTVRVILQAHTSVFRISLSVHARAL
jgi:hypothetical protein